ncbi:hypothetical protein [Bradyrhizobium japonicum]|uniref:hypothetical protein n=1 Tax=Bradyrhizobium japonicum TaxID=375 RepID=UPI001181BBBA|nr:hypothetical protein [Bradyrhizobium japonicum]
MTNFPADTPRTVSTAAVAAGVPYVNLSAKGSVGNREPATFGGVSEAFRPSTAARASCHTSGISKDGFHELVFSFGLGDFSFLVNALEPSFSTGGSLNDGSFGWV